MRFWDLDPCLPCILAASLWLQAVRDYQLADGHCRGLRAWESTVDALAGP